MEPITSELPGFFTRDSGATRSALVTVGSEGKVTVMEDSERELEELQRIVGEIGRLTEEMETGKDVRADLGKLGAELTALAKEEPSS